MSKYGEFLTSVRAGIAALERRGKKWGKRAEKKLRHAKELKLDGEWVAYGNECKLAYESELRATCYVRAIKSILEHIPEEIRAEMLARCEDCGEFLNDEDTEV